MMGAFCVALGSDARRVFWLGLLLLLATMCSTPHMLEASSRGRFLNSGILSLNETNEMSNPESVYFTKIRSEAGSGDFTEELPVASLADTEEEQSHSRGSPSVCSKSCYRSQAVAEDPPPDDLTPPGKNSKTP